MQTFFNFFVIIVSRVELSFQLNQRHQSVSGENQSTAFHFIHSSTFPNMSSLSFPLGLQSILRDIQV